MKQQTRIKWTTLLLFMGIVMALTVACTSPQNESSDNSEHNSSEMEMEHDDDEMEHDDGEMDMDHDDEEMDMDHDEGDLEHGHGSRIENPDGATIHIISPTANSTTGSDFTVEVEISHFELDHEGSHWHIYVDGESHGMVLGHTEKTNLRGIAPGEHTVEAFLANGDHVEFQDGGMIKITVEE